jgi:hypothetical protein|tara:strand:- start:46 stop:627 length:582 start_codon:yes stop_codon:yes gene_type:complete
MSNGHSAEAIEATQMDEESYQQQQLEERDMQEEEQLKDQSSVDRIERIRAKRMEDLSDESQPLSKKQFMTKLVTDNGLIPKEDIFSKPNQWAIIKLTGIEKIQQRLNIRVVFDSVVIEKDFAVIKATATGRYDSVQSYGSATKGRHPDGNVAHAYLVEMAEKRAKARAVLKLCGAYKYGVYAEDESEEFKQEK